MNQCRYDYSSAMILEPNLNAMFKAKRCKFLAENIHIGIGTLSDDSSEEKKAGMMNYLYAKSSELHTFH